MVLEGRIAGFLTRKSANLVGNSTRNVSNSIRYVGNKAEKWNRHFWLQKLVPESRYWHFLLITTQTMVFCRPEKAISVTANYNSCPNTPLCRFLQSKIGIIQSLCSSELHILHSCTSRQYTHIIPYKTRSDKTIPYHIIPTQTKYYQIGNTSIFFLL